MRIFCMLTINSNYLNLNISAIVPKNLNKNKLKNILNAQCDEYEYLIQKFHGIGVIFYIIIEINNLN